MESNTEEAATASQPKEGIIYLLMKDNNIYIGSTIQDLKKRMYTHKKDSKTKNNKLYKFIRDTGGIEKFNIQYPFDIKYPSNIIDCDIHNNKNDCDKGYQCVWIEEKLKAYPVNTPFCTGNMFAVPT